MDGYIFQGNNIYLDSDLFSEKSAGGSKTNYWLFGLPYKITVNSVGDIQAVYLYSSDLEDDTSNRFSFTNDGSGVWTYIETAGTVATALSITTKSSANFQDGIKFNFIIEIIGNGQTKKLYRRFWVRDPQDLILFGTDKLAYIEPYPVMIGETTNIVAIASKAINSVNVSNHGGIATVEVFDTPSALSDGPFVTTIAETAVASVTSIDLANRTTLAYNVPGFLPPPGSPDFSRFYHYITFRLRAKLGSSSYRDYPVVLFAARACKNGTYGYDSTGIVLPAPTLPGLTIEPPVNPPEGPPPVCSSKTELKTDNPLNVYSQSITVSVYDSASGGNLIASGIPIITGINTLTIARTELGGNTNDPIEGFFEISEVGPDRTSINRYETIVYGCLYEPVVIDTVTYNGTTGQLVTTGVGTGFLPGETYAIEYYANKEDTTPTNTYDAVYQDETTLLFTATENKDGYWSITRNDIVISEKEQESYLYYAASATIQMLSPKYGDVYYTLDLLRACTTVGGRKTEWTGEDIDRGRKIKTSLHYTSDLLGCWYLRAEDYEWDGSDWVLFSIAGFRKPTAGDIDNPNGLYNKVAGNPFWSNPIYAQNGWNNCV